MLDADGRAAAAMAAVLKSERLALALPHRKAAAALLEAAGLGVAAPAMALHAEGLPAAAAALHAEGLAPPPPPPRAWTLAAAVGIATSLAGLLIAAPMTAARLRARRHRDRQRGDTGGKE